MEASKHNTAVVLNERESATVVTYTECSLHEL